MFKYEGGASAENKLLNWISESFAQGGDAPFSFEYGGVPSCEFIREAAFESEILYEDEEKEIKNFSYSLPDNLLATVELTRFKKFSAAEWTVYFENAGRSDSKILSNVRALDLVVEYPPFRSEGTLQYGAHDVEFFYNGGSDCKVDDFIPLREVLHHLSNKKYMRFNPVGGRPSSGSHGGFPYFNLKTFDCGAIFAIGWAGQWEAELHKFWLGESDAALRFEAGMPGTHAYLKPGEKIRTPKILFLPWNGTREDSQNIFRRFMLEHHHPRVGDKKVRLPLSVMSWGTDEADHMKQLDAIESSGIKPEAYWVDAGWYGPDGTRCEDPLCDDWGNNVGYFGHNAKRYPNGFKKVSDRARRLGMKFLLWFEHERVKPGTPLTFSHPEFLLKNPDGKQYLFDMGNPEARKWMTEMLSEKITEYGIDVLRVDHNVDSLWAWDANDEPERRGITQIRCVEGFYALWDSLRERFPDLIIDNCASGGRRLEIDSMSRSVSLTRTDYMCYADSDALGHQMHTCGLGMWVPVSGVLGGTLDLYDFRSRMNNGLAIEIELIYKALESPDIMETIKRRLIEFERLRELYAADMYLHTDINISRKEWFAYQLNSPELGRGALLSFRRDECPFERARYLLKGLEPDCDYEIEDADSGSRKVCTGGYLMKEGLEVHLPERRSSSLIYITKRI